MRFERVLTANRVIYGKSSTPVEDREYKSFQLGTSAVGNRKDFKEIAQSYGYNVVEFVELDGSKDRVEL